MVSFNTGPTALETVGGELGQNGWNIMCKVGAKTVKAAVMQTEHKEEARERKIRKVHEEGTISGSGQAHYHNK